MTLENINMAQEIYDIQPLCTKRFNAELRITRVPGGWIFSRLGIEGSGTTQVTETFVPYSAEFKDL